MQPTSQRIATTLLAAAAFLCAAHAFAHDGTGAVDYARMPAGAFSVVAEIQARPGRADELRTITRPLVDGVRGDPKNLVYFLQEDRARPGHFVFYEVFANEQDFNAHNETPYVKAWFARLAELAEGPVKVTKLQILGPRP